MNIWNSFWDKKSKKMEWSQEDILKSKGNIRLSNQIQKYLHKSWKKVVLLELGAGMGLTSLYFAKKGVKTTLLDYSPNAQIAAREYWKGYANHKFLIQDLFTFKTKNRYDIIMSFGLCEHFTGKQRELVLQKHIEFLKQEGIAIISVPYKYGVFYRISKKTAELLHMWSFGLEIPFSKKEFIEFAKKNNLSCEIIMGGFYSSAYDFLVRKPLKVMGIRARRRFDDTRSIFDRFFGSGILVILKKN